jgi:hypothetical protein
VKRTLSWDLHTSTGESHMSGRTQSKFREEVKLMPNLNLELIVWPAQRFKVFSSVEPWKMSILMTLSVS